MELELVIGFIKRRAAPSAYVGPGFVVVVVLAGEGPLRALELVIGFIKRRAAPSAYVGPGFVVVVVLAGEGPLRALLNDDRLFLGCQILQSQASLLFAS
jgi:hypothetical protein